MLSIGILIAEILLFFKPNDWMTQYFALHIHLLNLCDCVILLYIMLYIKLYYFWQGSPGAPGLKGDSGESGPQVRKLSFLCKESAFFVVQSLICFDYSLALNNNL